MLKYIKSSGLKLLINVTFKPLKYYKATYKAKVSKRTTLLKGLIIYYKNLTLVNISCFLVNLNTLL